MNETASRAYVIGKVHAERDRQDTLHNNNLLHSTNPYFGVAVLAEEVGEVAQAAQDGDIPAYLEELIQVAAVAVAMAQQIVLSSHVDETPV